MANGSGRRDRDSVRDREEEKCVDKRDRDRQRDKERNRESDRGHGRDGDRKRDRDRIREEYCGRDSREEVGRDRDKEQRRDRDHRRRERDSDGHGSGRRDWVRDREERDRDRSREWDRGHGRDRDGERGRGRDSREEIHGDHGQKDRERNLNRRDKNKEDDRDKNIEGDLNRRDKNNEGDPASISDLRESIAREKDGASEVLPALLESSHRFIQQRQANMEKKSRLADAFSKLQYSKNETSGNKFNDDSLSKKPKLSHYDHPTKEKAVTLDQGGCTSETEKILKEFLKKGKDKEEAEKKDYKKNTIAIEPMKEQKADAEEVSYTLQKAGRNYRNKTFYSVPMKKQKASKKSSNAYEPSHLKSLKEEGALEDGKMKAKLVGFAAGERTICLERIDGSGRVMDPKEAFQYAANQFRGFPGKMKLEKPQKKYIEELKAKRMREVQTRSQTPNVANESGNAKSSPTGDASGFATVEKEHPARLTPMLGDKMVEHALGIKRSAQDGSLPPLPPKESKS